MKLQFNLPETASEAFRRCKLNAARRLGLNPIGGRKKGGRLADDVAQMSMEHFRPGGDKLRPFQLQCVHHRSQ